jgi:methylated-DNA-[protein]-cysteine S-methyltransferase
MTEIPTAVAMLDSPLGPLQLRAAAGALCGLYLPSSKHPPPALTAPHADDPASRAVLAAATQQLRAYFAGQRSAFDLPLAPVGTPFQQQVWKRLQEIPFAQTCSYAALARAVDRPRAVRAVGAANGRNPISIIIPCHRVIGSDGTLTGYGGGEPAKRWLLDHEAAVMPAATHARAPHQTHLPFTRRP